MSLGNEGAYLPSSGNGEIPTKYWETIDKTAKELAQSGILKKGNVGKVLDAIRHTLTPNQTMSLHEAVESKELIERFKERAGKPIEFEGLSTGFPTLDETLKGIQRQNFMVICARTGVGKTLLANFMVAKFAEQGERILYLALEESEEEVGDRWAKVVQNNGFNIPDDKVYFMFGEKISNIKEDKQNIIPLIATASQLGYTMVVVDMLNNLIDTVRDENSNVLLNRIIDVCHKTDMTLIMTARLRQPLSDQEKDFPQMESVYGRVDLGYIVSKCIAVTAVADTDEYVESIKSRMLGEGRPIEEIEKLTWLRISVLKNRRKQIGMKPIWPILSVNNLLQIEDTGSSDNASRILEEYENNNGRAPKRSPFGTMKGAGGMPV